MRWSGIPTLLGGLVLAKHPIVRVELWNGPELVEATDYEEAATEVRPAWEWVAPGAGLYGLVLRALDDRGGVATSFPLWVRARDPEVPDGVNLSAQPSAGTGVLLGFGGSPLRTLRVPSPGPPDISIDPESCAATITLAAAVEGSSGIGVYAASFGAAGFVPIGLLPPSGGTVPLMIGASPILLYSEAFDATTAAPSPPAVIYPPNPCAQKGWEGDLAFANGLLQNPKGADRAYLYTSRDGGEDWDRVPATDQTFVFPDGDGAFDFGGMLPEAAPGTTTLFEAWGWVAGTLTPLGTGSWTSPVGTPGGTGGTAAPGPNVVGAPYGGPLVMDSDLSWKLGTGDAGPILTHQGMICTYKPQAPTMTTTTAVPVSVVGGSTTLPTTPTTAAPGIGILPTSCTNHPFGQYSKVFRWQPWPGTFTHGILQVSTKPPPDAPALSYPGLIYTKTVEKPTGEFVEFEVPLGDLINPPPASASLPNWEAMGFEISQNLAGLGGAGSTNTYSFLPTEQLFGETPTVFYVRVVPMQEAKSLLGQSNEVVITIEDTAPQPAPAPGWQPPAISLAVRMTPPHLPNGKYERCVRVVSNPFGSKNPDPATTWLWNATHKVPLQFALPGSYGWAESSAFIYENGVKVNKGLVPGATVCASHLDPPEKDVWDYIVDAVTFVGWVWDMYVGVWDMMKGWAADILAYASGCVTLAKATGMSTKDAEKKCSGFATTAINVALAAYGIPPTMPKFQDLVELGKGELKQVLIQMAKDQGFDCSVLQSECDKMAEKLLDELLDQIQVAATQAATKSAVAGSQWVLSIHPGIYVIPEPAGILSPATFEITITRSSIPGTPAPPATCTYAGSVSGYKAHHEWQNYQTGKWQIGPVFGSVMKSGKVEVDLSGMKPGEKRSAVLILDTILQFYPDGQSPQLPKTPWNVKPSTWIFFNAFGKGAAFTETNLIMQLSGGPLCGNTGQSHQQDNLATEPWEIPS